MTQKMETITAPAGLFAAMRRLLGTLQLPAPADQVAALLREIDACEVKPVEDAE